MSKFTDCAAGVFFTLATLALLVYAIAIATAILQGAGYL